MTKPKSRTPPGQLTFGLVVLDPDQQARLDRQKVRNCLKCGTAFVSEGPHNRLCSRCRYANANTYDPTCVCIPPRRATPC